MTTKKRKNHYKNKFQAESKRNYCLFYKGYGAPALPTVYGHKLK